MPGPVDVSLRKRPLPQENGNQQLTDFDEASGKRSRHDAVPNTAQVQAVPAIPNGTGNVMANPVIYGDHSIAPLISAFASLLAQGERGAASVQILVESLTPDMLAEIVIANMVHLPSTLPLYPPSVNPVANWGQGPLLPSAPAEIAANPLPSAPTESAAASQLYTSSVDTSRELRKVCAFDNCDSPYFYQGLYNKSLSKDNSFPFQAIRLSCDFNIAKYIDVHHIDVLVRFNGHFFSIFVLRS